MACWNMQFNFAAYLSESVKFGTRIRKVFPIFHSHLGLSWRRISIGQQKGLRSENYMVSFPFFFTPLEDDISYFQACHDVTAFWEA